MHWKYKSCHTTCYVTNLHPETDVCKSTCPETCHNTTFRWLKRARPSTKSRGIIGAQSRGSYMYLDNVTVDPYNRHIRSANPIMRHVMSLTWILKRICAKQHASKHAVTQPLHLHGIPYPIPDPRSQIPESQYAYEYM